MLEKWLMWSFVLFKKKAIKMVSKADANEGTHWYMKHLHYLWIALSYSYLGTFFNLNTKVWSFGYAPLVSLFWQEPLTAFWLSLQNRDTNDQGNDFLIKIFTTYPYNSVYAIRILLWCCWINTGITTPRKSSLPKNHIYWAFYGLNCQDNHRVPCTLW